MDFTLVYQVVILYSVTRIIRTKIQKFVRIKQKSMGKHTIVRITIVRIIRDVRISEGQSIRAIL